MFSRLNCNTLTGKYAEHFFFPVANEIMKWSLTELGKTMGGTVLGKDMFIENESTSGWKIYMYSPLSILLFFFIPQLVTKLCNSYSQGFE